MLEYASEALGRPVTEQELIPWLHDQNIETLFVERILTRAAPLIVHTRAYQKLLKAQYDFDAQLATFPPNHTFSEKELLPQARARARARLKIRDGAFAVTTFGYLHTTKGTYACLLALDFLRSWGIPAELHFVGSTALMPSPQTLTEVIQEFGLASHVRLYTNFVTDDVYRDYFIACDACVQLRLYGLGQPSAALADSIAAGVPSVASDELAATCEEP